MPSFPNNKWIVFMFLLAGLALCAHTGFAEDALKPLAQSMEQAQEGMTLWEMIKAGGIIMIVLAVLSVFTIALVLFNFWAVKEKRLVPAEFSDKFIQKLEDRDKETVPERIILSRALFFPG